MGGWLYLSPKSVKEQKEEGRKEPTYMLSMFFFLEFLRETEKNKNFNNSKPSKKTREDEQKNVCKRRELEGEVV
jgi:hypothetical protein